MIFDPKRSTNEKVILSACGELQAGLQPRAPSSLKPKRDIHVIAGIEYRIQICEELIDAIARTRHLTQLERREAMVAQLFGLNDPLANAAAYLGNNYLMLLSSGTYKFGKSIDPDRRIEELKRDYRKKVTDRGRFLTVVPFELESELKAYFAPFRNPDPKRRELFDLPLQIVHRVLEVAAELEPEVLDRRQAELKSEIHRLKFHLTLA